MVGKRQSEIAGIAAWFWSGYDHPLEILRCDNNLPEDFPVFDHAQALNGTLEREYLIDDRFHGGILDELHQRLQIVIVEAVRAGDLQLEAPDVAQILLRIEPCGRAANQNFAASLHAFKRRLPCVPTREVDDDVHATLVAAALRLSILLNGPPREVNLFIIDDLVGAEFLQPPQLVRTRGTRDHCRSKHFRRARALCRPA